MLNYKKIAHINLSKFYPHISIKNMHKIKISNRHKNLSQSKIKSMKMKTLQKVSLINKKLINNNKFT